MRSLFICSTQLQILSAVSVVNAYPDLVGTPDIVLLSKHSKDKRWHETLSSLDIFEHIYALPMSTLPTKNEIKQALKECTSESDLNLYSAWQLALFRFCGHKFLHWSTFVLNNGAFKRSHLSKSKYDTLFVGSTDPITVELVKKLSVAHPVDIYGIDEGLGSYFVSIQNRYKNFKGTFLFAPECAEEGLNAFAIPKLDADTQGMQHFRDQLQANFGQDLLVINEGAYFLDQFAYMPWTLNPKRDQWQSFKYIIKKDEILKSLLSMDKYGNLCYMPHPSQLKEATEHYINMGFNVLESAVPFPFELNLLSHAKKGFDDEKITFLTNYSTSVLSYILFFTEKRFPNFKSIFLYKIFDNQYPELWGIDKAINAIERIKAKHPEHVFVPETIDELRELLTS